MKMIFGPLRHLLNKQETKIEKVHFLKKKIMGRWQTGKSKQHVI